MSGHYLMRLNSNDGTKYNLLSWTMFCVGTAFFLFFVICGSLITPGDRVPHILACFLISGAALVLAAYAVFKLVTFHKIKMSRTRSSSDDEMTVDSDPAEASQARLLSKTDPLPINGTTYDSIHSSRNPSFSPPTDSLVGLFSGESLRSRSWLYLASEASCRFRRSFSYDGSVSSMTPYAYGTFQQPDSAIVNDTSSSSLVEHPVYAVPNKGASRNDLSARSRSGLVEDPNYHLPLDCVSSSSQVDIKKAQTRIATRSCLKNTDCYSHLKDGSYASPPQALSNKNQQGERLGFVKDSSLSNPLYGASYASSPQISSSKDPLENNQRKRSGLVKGSGLSNPLYGASYANSPQLSSSKDPLENNQRKRSGLVKDSGLSNPLYGASYASSMQTFLINQSQNQQGERSGLVKDSDHYNPLDGASCVKFSRMSSSKDQSQNQQGARSSLVKDPNHDNRSNAASYAREDNSYGGDLTDQSPEYYYPLASSSDKAIVIENPFIWPTTYQSNEGESENTVNSSMKEPTKQSKRIKGKKVNSASKIYHRKLQKRHDKKMYLKGRRVRTDEIPQDYVGMSTYGPREELKVIFAHRLSSYSSEVSSPDEESYMGPTRV